MIWVYHIFIQIPIKYMTNGWLDAGGLLIRYANCDEFIQELKDGRLPSQAGCNPEETLEVRNVLKHISSTLLSFDISVRPVTVRPS